MTGVWPFVNGLPTEVPGTQGTVLPLLSEGDPCPLESSFFITAVVTLFSPMRPFVPSDSLIPLDIFTFPFSTFPFEWEEEEEDFLCLKSGAERGPVWDPPFDNEELFG